MGVSLPGRVDRPGASSSRRTSGGRTSISSRCSRRRRACPSTSRTPPTRARSAELWFGRHAEHVRNLVAVTVSEGIGVGLLLNGQLVHGANAMAGEFGHVSSTTMDRCAVAASAAAGSATRRTRPPSRGTTPRRASGNAAQGQRRRRDAVRGSWRLRRTRGDARAGEALDADGALSRRRPGGARDRPRARGHRHHRRGDRRLGSRRADRRGRGAGARLSQTTTRIVPTDPRRSRVSAAP